MYYKFADYNIYSKRIGFFLNGKEKVGSYFGISLTIIYILSSIILFIHYINIIIQRKQMNIYDSKVYSQETPIIEVNSNLIYFAFGLEDKSSNRFVDETIYFPKILFFDRTKINGEFQNIERRELEYEICNRDNFGEGYKQFFKEDELNNSYCLKNYNLNLIGGYKYDRMSYFRIKLYPCLNNSENNNHCKPQEIIDQYLKGGYFSIITKDIGLNPSNYNFPIIPTLQDLYTTIDKKMFRDYILYYGITEIQTDIGLFFEDIKIKKYLQFRKETSTFFFRNESEYYEGKAMISIAFRLDDLINIQKREYLKITEVFSTVGGYMQLLSTIFNLLTFLSNKYIPHLKIINSIFNFNLKQKKMIMKINSIKDLNLIYFSKNCNNCILLPSKKNKFQNNNNINNSKNINISNNISNNSLIAIDNNENSSVINILNNKKNKNFKFIKTENSKNILMDKKNKRNSSFVKSRYSPDKNNNNQKQKYIHRIGSYYPNKMESIEEKRENDSKYESGKDINIILKEIIDHIKINMFEYYCFKSISKKRNEIELFTTGVSLYKKRMDIVNVFTLLLLTEKYLLGKES